MSIGVNMVGILGQRNLFTGEQRGGSRRLGWREEWGQLGEWSGEGARPLPLPTKTNCSLEMACFGEFLAGFF